MAAGLLVYFNYQSRRAATEQRLLETARALTMVMGRELANIQVSLRALATSPSLLAGDFPAFYRQALAVQESQLGEHILLADADGQLRLNTLRPLGSRLPKRAASEASRQIYSSGQPLVRVCFINSA
jgi:hypothetical protein